MSPVAVAVAVLGAVAWRTATVSLQSVWWWWSSSSFAVVVDAVVVVSKSGDLGDGGCCGRGCAAVAVAVAPASRERDSKPCACLVLALLMSVLLGASFSSSPSSRFPSRRGGQPEVGTVGL